MLRPASKGNIVGMIRQMTNSFLNIIDVNSTIQVRRVLWSGFWLVSIYIRMDNVRPTSGYFFYRKLYDGGKGSTFVQNKTNFYTILTRNLYDKKKDQALLMYLGEAKCLPVDCCLVR
jgi:hypothetical protein